MTDQPTAQTLTPEIVSAILRDESSPLFPSQIGVFCDDCGVVEEGDYLVHEEMTKTQRLQVARDHLAKAKGWKCDDEGDFCADCR